MTDRALRRDPDDPGGTRQDRMGADGDGDGGAVDRAAADRPAAGDQSARDGGGDRERLAEDRTREPAGDGGAALIEPERARGYQDRWQVLKGDFVDEPRRAVRDANALVGEVLDDLETTFRRQRERLERDLGDSDASTEDLRLALGRYRSFFDRLLTL